VKNNGCAAKRRVAKEETLISANNETKRSEAALRAPLPRRVRYLNRNQTTLRMGVTGGLCAIYGRETRR